MEPELISWTAIVAARQLVPSSLTHAWFVNNAIIGIDEFESPTLFTDAFVQVQSRNFVILATPELIQFAPKPNLEHEGEVVSGKLLAILLGLPGAAYTAIGLNFIYHTKMEEGQIEKVTRNLFFRDGVPIFSQFNDPSARFGSYMSINWEGMRLKMDIQPVIVRASEKNENRVQIAFNFHRDVDSTTPIEKIKQSLELWDRAKLRSRELVNLAMGDGH